MKSKYSHTVYEIVKIKSNTLYIKNSKGDEQKVKKDNVKEHYEKMKQLIKDKDALTALIIEVEFQIFYKSYSF